MDLTLIFILLFTFQIKHFVSDYILQGTYMLGKFKKVGWGLPLISHCAVHMICTLAILLSVLSFTEALILAFADFVIHFCIDRLKVLLSRKYNSDKDKEFWWYLGADQMAHHMTHYILILTVIYLIKV